MPRCTPFRLLAALLALTVLGTAPAMAKDLLGNKGGFEKGATTYNMWGGVDNNNKLRTVPRKANVVTTTGQVRSMDYPSSVGAGDFNGDGLPDLVVTDATGYFWFFKNIGSATDPKFGHGQLLDVWITPRLTDSTASGVIRAANKLHLVDYNQDGRLDLIVGNYLGQIFMLPNRGSTQKASFSSPPADKLDSSAVPTDDKLWGNFFSPFYYDWDRDGRRDLILGDGTYATNNIFLLPNSANSQNPQFKPEDRRKLIVGFGKEHLTPQVVDWNADGNPDIITGEREGNVTVYINKNGDPDDTEFEEVGVKFGSSTRLGELSSAVPYDMNGDGLFDILTTSTNGRISMALNEGTKGNPKFGRPKEIGGKQPYPEYKAPADWSVGIDDQFTLWVLRLVGSNEKEAITYDPEANMPEGSKYAVKLEFVEPIGPEYTEPIPIPQRDQVRIVLNSKVTLKERVEYEIKFRTKGSGFGRPKLCFERLERDSGSNHRILETTPVRMGSSWTEQTWKMSFKRPRSSPQSGKPAPMSFYFDMNGKGTFYADDITITELE